MYYYLTTVKHLLVKSSFSRHRQCIFSLAHPLGVETDLEGDAAPRLPQQLLQTLDALVGDADPVDLPDLVPNMQRGLATGYGSCSAGAVRHLSVDHPPVHDAADDTLACRTE